jgi:hypothetical protein
MSWIERHIGSQHLFFSALVFVPAFVLQRSVSLKAFQAILFMLLCAFSERRVLVLRALMILFFITFFHLISPAGRVLLAVGPLNITSIALRTGLHRGLTVLGLYYISQFCVREDLRFPGPLGRLLSRIFFYYGLFLQKARLDPRRPVESLDELLLSTHRMSPTGRESGVSTDRPGALFLLGMMIISGSLSLWCLLRPDVVLP